MADRVSASIVLGGTLTASAFADLADLIVAEGLSTEWDGAPFEPGDLEPGKPLSLFAHEVAGGTFDEIEAWCVTNGTPFVRWCGEYAGQWGPQREVFTGSGVPVTYAVTEDGEVVIDRFTIEKLGSLKLILARFDAAEFSVPPLVIRGEPAASSPTSTPSPNGRGNAHVQ